jgi:PAS domain S-box-containing protein
MTEHPRSVESRLRAAVESSPSGLLMIDAEGRIVLVNREIERLFGYSREELLGRSVDVLVPERYRHGHPVFRTGFMGSPRVRPMGAGRDLFGLRKDGTEVPVEIGLTPVATEDGLFVLSSIVDISARKQAEADRRQLEEQLRHSQKMEAIGTLAGGVAHDFNNVLAAIIGFTEFARDASAEPGVRADLAEALQAAERGRQIVERVLAFSRRKPLEPRPLALDGVVQEVAGLLRATLPPSIAVRTFIAPESPRVLADPGSLHQVLMNLSTNAAHSMPAGGELEIRVEPFYVRDSVARARPNLREGTYTRLAVRDTGHGIDPSLRDRVFEPFFTTKPQGSGTGLGLAIVHGIIRDHEGVVELTSTVGSGTTVECLLPALDHDRIADQARADAVPRGHGERVLLIDDEPTLVEIGRRRLEELGYRVVAEAHPELAIARILADPGAVDLVISDYSMAELSGLEVVRRMRAAAPALPAILLTGFVDELPAETLSAAGIDRVLRKPVSIPELARSLAELLREHTRPEH